MPIRYINTGSGANSGDGDSLRSAFIKVNNNFAFIESIAAMGYTGSAGLGYTGSAGAGYTGSAGAGYTGSAGTSGTALGDRLTAGTTSTLVLLADGTLKLTHPTEWWSGDYSLEIQKAAGNYHTFKSAYGLSLQATPVPNGYGLNTNTNFVDIFHDGVSVNVNDNSWGFGTDGTTTFPDGYLKIVPNGANPYISNRTDNGLGLVSGSAIQIRQSVADAYGISIDSSITDTSLGGGALLASGSNIDVNGSKIILGQYTVNNLDANTGLSVQNKIEINNTAILIGQYVSTLTSGTTTSAFSGWTFGTDGVLTLPGGNTQISNQGMANTASSVVLASVGATGGAALEWISDAELNTSTKIAFVIANNPLSANSGTVQIATGGITFNGPEQPPVLENVWDFGTNGTLTIPDDIQDANGSVVRVATTSTAPTRVNGQLWFNTIDGRGYIRYNNAWIDLNPTEVAAPSTYLDGLTINDTTISAVDTTATVSIESGSHIWEFGTDGLLTLPAGLSRVTSYGQLTIETDNSGSGMYANATGVNLLYANSNVTLRANSTGTTKDWTFGADGNLTFPNNTVQTTAWPGGNSRSLATTANSLNNFNIGNFINNASLDINYTAFTGDYGIDFNISYQAPLDGTKGVTVGAVETPLILSTGTVILKTNISSSTSTWTFGTDGSLTLPEGGVIKTSTGTNILDGLVGAAGFATTSTLVNGTSTVSLSSTGTLTVPGNIIPDADSIYSLGSPTRKFKDLYVSTTTIYMGDLVISGSPSTGLTINGNAANSKQTFVGGEGTGPDNCALIKWSTGTNYLIVRSPGTNFKLIMEGLKTGNTFNAVGPIDFTFTVSSTLWQFDNEITPGYPEYRIGVNETNVSFSGEYIYLLAVPVPERTNVLSNGIYSLTLNSTGTVTLPGLLTLPVTTSIPAITTATGTVAVCDGTLWDGGGDGFEHLMIYINDVWTKVV